ncbi:CubicO group peptidase (beta-lactamase class C family) [Flavobacteriaceae bacterium MAR_2009_75]|nr:CubicO group peptidase (beta-lactamase class C family) [Flavobacteriaceae bacterium MAR_2009_75]
MISIHTVLRTFVLIISILVIGCGPSLSKQNTSNPYWATSNPQTEGIDAQALDAIDQDIKNGKYGLIDQFLVIKNEKLVYDKAYHHDYHTLLKADDTTSHQYNYNHPDWHPFYNSTKLHTIQSVTKSIISLLIGIAADEGLMIPLDSTVYSLFPEYRFAFSDERKKSITLNDLLTMRSGIEWDESSSYADEQNNNGTIMEQSDDWIRYVLERPMDTLPGTTFVYNSGVPVLLGKIISNTTGKQVDKWAEEKLFGPLGITEYYWKKAPKGEIDTQGGLYLSTYDLAKIGYLMLNKGVWENKQIVSKDWIEKSTQPSAKLSDQVAYGYQWWIPEYENDSTKIFAGNGYGNQYLMMSEEHHMLVVFNGWNIHEETEKSAWKALQDRILPALKNN